MPRLPRLSLGRSGDGWGGELASGAGGPSWGGRPGGRGDRGGGGVRGVRAGVRAGAAGRRVRGQAPASTGFTGRDDVLAALAELFGDAGGPARHGPVICSISGMAGIGKTALAIHAAQRLA